MKEFLKDISRIPLMTREEEQKTGKLAFKGSKKAQNKLVQANLRFVVKMARKYAASGIEEDDLISIGCEALMYAATKYNPDCGTRFISYAVWWIRDYINKAMYGSYQTIRVPMNKKYLLKDKRFQTCSLNKFLDEDESGGTLEDLISDGKVETQNALIEKMGARADINMEMKKLSELEQKIITLRYGLKNGECESLSAVGSKLGYSKERIRQIENRALRKLKAGFEKIGYENFAA